MGPWAVPLAMAAGSAILGMYQGRQQQQAQSQARRDQALINMYAPLLGQPVQALPMEQNMVMPAAIQGGITGYQMYSDYMMNDKLGKLYDAQIAKSAADSAVPAVSTPTPIVSPAAPLVAQSPGGARPFGFIPEGPYLENPYAIWRK